MCCPDETLFGTFHIFGQARNLLFFPCRKVKSLRDDIIIEMTCKNTKQNPGGMTLSFHPSGVLYGKYPVFL